MTSELDDFWRKDGQRGEMIIYELLGRHPRIVSYHGHDPVSFELLLQRHPKSDLNYYLQQHPDVPFQDRLAWAVEIAQGIAYLHSKEVVWNDMHLGNVLVTDDLHVVLCDFGGSYFKPDPTYFFKIGPPLPYICPDDYYGRTNKRQDIFGFGVMLFVILTKRYPHCPTSGFTLSIDEIDKIFQLHQNHNFDALPDAKFPYLARIINNCFNISYQSGAELLLDLEDAYSSWTKKFENREVQDPDVSFSYDDISDNSGTTAVHSRRPPDPDPIALDICQKIMSNMRSNPEFKEMFKTVEENSMKMRSMSAVYQS